MNGKKDRSKISELLSWLIFYIFAGVSILTAAIISLAGPGGNFLIRGNIIGDKAFVFKIIATAAIIIFINFILTGFLFRREKFLSYVLSVATFIFSIIVSAAVASYFYF